MSPKRTNVYRSKSEVPSLKTILGKTGGESSPPELAPASDSSSKSSFEALIMTSQSSLNPVSPASPGSSLGENNKLAESWQSASTKRFRTGSSRSHRTPRGNCLLRTSSVPLNIGASSASPSPTSTRLSLSKILDEASSKNPHFLNAQHLDGEDGSTVGDSTIEESWRPKPEMRRSLMESEATATPTTLPSPSTQTKALDNFLDALIFDAKNQNCASPGAIYRKRLEKRNKSSGRSVGSAMDRKKRVPLPPGSPARVSGENFAAALGGEDSSKALSPSRSSPGEKASHPIVWSRKSSARRVRSRSTSRRSEPPNMIEAILHDSSISTRSDLGAFLERESRHGRPTSAHTVSGDMGRDSESDTVSIKLSKSSNHGKSKTYQVGPLEARIIEYILQSAQDRATSQSPARRNPANFTTDNTKVDHSEHDTTVRTQSSDIAESDRISTRSSLLVELSPGPVDGSQNKSDLKTYLERRRVRDRRTSAFTVAGDRVAVRFQGRSTQELLELLDAEKKQKRIPGLPLFAGPTRSTSMSATEAYHRTGSSSQDTKSSPKSQNDRVKESGRILDRSASEFLTPASPETTARQDLQLYLDRRSPKSNRPDKRGKERRRSGGQTQNPISTSPRTPRQTIKKFEIELSSPRDINLEEFRLPLSARPTNRRSLMRKMHSVPILTEFGRSQSLEPTPRRQRSSRKLISDESSADGRITPKRQGSLERQGSTRRNKNHLTDSTDEGRRSPRKGSKKKSAASEDEEADLTVEDLHRSFLDKFLDGDVEAHDSASQIANNVTDSPTRTQTPPLKRKEAYKAALEETTPIEDSTSKLRIEPEFLGESRRMILNDPVNTKGSRRDLIKMKSVPANITPSDALKDLYVQPSEQNKKIMKKEGKKGGKKGSKKLKGKAKKLKAPTQVKESRPEKPTPAITAESPCIDKRTLKDLPRFNQEKIEDAEEAKKQKLLASGNLLQKMQSCPQVDKRAYDVADRLLLVQRLNSLTNNISPFSPGGSTKLVSENDMAVEKMRKNTPPKTPETPTSPDEGLKKSVSERFTAQALQRCDALPTTPSSRKAKSPRRLRVPHTVQSERSKNVRPYGMGTGSYHGKPKSGRDDKKGQSSSNLHFGSWHGQSTEDDLGFTTPPLQPVRKSSVEPGKELLQESATRWTSTPARLASPDSPRKTHRGIPGVIGEGSTLELDDNNTVASDITDAFSTDLTDSTSNSPYYSKRGLSNLDKINENNHCDNIHSDSATRASSSTKEKAMHLSRRWQSTTNIDSPARMKNRLRDTSDHVDGVKQGRQPKHGKKLGWLKKKFHWKK